MIEASKFSDCTKRRLMYETACWVLTGSGPNTPLPDSFGTDTFDDTKGNDIGH